MAGQASEAGDRLKQPGSATALGNPSLYNEAALQTSDEKIASDLGISESQLSPGIISAYQQQEAERAGGFWEHTIMDKVVPAVVIGGLTAGAGSALGGYFGAELGATAGEVSAASIAGDVAGYGVAGAATSAGVAYGSGQNIGEAALKGGETGAIGGAVAGGIVPAAGGAINDATGLGTTASDALAGAGVGAIKGEITGQSVLGDAVSGGVGGAIQGSGLKQDISNATGSNIVGNVATSELSSIAGSTVTSATGHSATSGSTFSSGGGGNLDDSLSPGVAPVSTPNPMSTIQSQPTAANLPTTPGSSPSTSFGSDVLGGLASTLGGGSLGQDLGTLLPYAGVAAIGEAQANAGQAQDAKYSQQQQALAQPAIAESKSLQGQYDTGTLNPADKAVVDTGIAQGQDTIASANGLSAIAQTAFANYNSGKLNAGDQAALDANVASQKQQVAQQLASAGITDSTILAAQNQQIDNAALISKQNTLNGYFDTGNAAYNSWLTATNEGKAAITAAQTYASTSLQTYLQNSMMEAGIGIGEVNTAIQTQMQTDEQYAAQMSTLLGTLATAYAKQIAGKQSSSGSNPLSALTKGAAGSSGIPKVPGVTTQGSGAPTAGDISNSTAGAGTIDPSELDALNNIQEPDINLPTDFSDDAEEF